jgi:lipopolysaccharide/colanic/teichoic acid biosynthesis glycosyltransferase
MSRGVLKRMLDVTASAAGLVLLAPLLLATALAVRLRLGSPVLFRQVRPGLQGRPFTMVKFRTMTTAVDERGKPLPTTVALQPSAGRCGAPAWTSCRPSGTCSAAT